MTVKKANGTVFKVPNWLVLLGIWGVVDLVVGVTKTITGKKDENKVEATVK